MGADDRFFVFGEDPFVALNTATDASPVWNEIEYGEEFNFDNSKSEGTFKPRATKFELYRGAKHSTVISFKYSLTLGVDPIADALYESFVTGCAIQFVWADRPLDVAGVRGVKAWCEVMKFPMPSKAEEGVMIDIEAKPTDYAEAGELIVPEYLE